MKEFKVVLLRWFCGIPPIANWIKCNIDGAALGSPGQSSCGGLFRDSSGDCIGCFAENLGVQTDFYAELMAAINAIEIANSKNWQSLWLKVGADGYSLYFLSASTWQIRNRWLNCMIKIWSMNFMVTHIYREGNSCADKLANIGVSLSSFTWWNEPPTQILAEIFCNRLGLGFEIFFKILWCCRFSAH